jgi:hypothetical protein
MRNDSQFGRLTGLLGIQSHMDSWQPSPGPPPLATAKRSIDAIAAISHNGNSIPFTASRLLVPTYKWAESLFGSRFALAILSGQCEVVDGVYAVSTKALHYIVADGESLPLSVRHCSQTRIEYGAFSGSARFQSFFFERSHSLFGPRWCF